MMDIKKELNIPSFKYANDKFNELKDQFIEMSRIKSDFDIDKFTVKKDGNFIAHNFHFLMRQYSLTLSELRRMTIKKEELERDIQHYTELLEKGEYKIIVYEDGKKVEKYVDLYIKELINQLDLLEINIMSKAQTIVRYEYARQKLVEINGGEITDEQFQKEEPEYWQWFITKKALQERKQAVTGISEGVWNSIDYMEEIPLLNPKNQLQILDDKGNIDIKKFEADIELRKKIGYAYDSVVKQLRESNID